ncbi:MAG TPA: O-antigen ligase family protein [Solirubrobacter sp.]|nr:O-antigen ligase family protein [Solirubrobacter sp.]
MASLTVRRRVYVGPRRSLRRRLLAIRPPWWDPRAVLAGGVALACVLTAFTAGGGSQLKRTTSTEVALMLGGAALCALAFIVPRSQRTPKRVRGAVALAAFAALAVYTALSMTWSLTPGESWLETNRTFAYLATMAAGLALGRLAPRQWGAMLIGVALAAVVICGWSLLTKIFPAALAPDESFARLRPPFQYWNSVGLAAALGIPPLLWLAARRSGHAAVNVLAWPGLGLLVLCLMLSFSRGALLAVGLTLILWFALVPLRLRAVVALGGVLVATLPLVLWAFAQEGLATDRALIELRVDAGQALGALVLLLLVALTVAGLAVGFLSAHRPPTPRQRARASRVLVGAIATVPAVAILLLANAPGGIDGQVSKAWRQATDPTISGPANDPGRFTAASSARARYWREAIKAHADSPVLGNGAGSYSTVRLRYRLDTRFARHAHGYVVQTLSDLGWVGLGLSLLATLAWLVTAALVLGLRRRDRGLPWDAERVGVATLAAVALLFGLHSAVDWTWFVPGNVVPALLCAGWVISRPHLRERLNATPAPAPAPSEPPVVNVVAAGVVLVIAVVAAWSALQPVRAVHAQDAVFDRIEKNALPAAASIARIAHERNPLSVEPLFELAAIEQAQGRNEHARRALEEAIDLEPANPETWRRLGQFRLQVLNDPKGALRAYQAAYYLDPKPARSISDVVTASRAVAAAGG